MLRPCGHAAHRLDQAAARDAVGEVELHRVIIQRLDLGNALAHRVGVGLQPLVQQQVVRKYDVMRRHRRAVREARLGAHVEGDPRLVLGVFEAFAEQAVTLAIDIRRQRLTRGRLPQQALETEDREQMRAALARIGVHRIQRTDEGDRDFPALGRIRVHVVEMLEIRRIGQIAVEGITVAFDDLLLLCRGGTGQQGRHHQRQRREPERQVINDRRTGRGAGLGTGHRSLLGVA